MALIDIHGLGDVQVALDRHEAILNGGFSSAQAVAAESFTASTEDLYQSQPFAVAATMTTTTQVGMFVALTRCRVTAAGLMLFNSAVVMNDTNYWTVQILRWRAGSSATIVTKSTKLSAASTNEAITQRQGWMFAATGFEATTNQILEPGDGLDFLFTPTGAPTALNNGVATVRYEPL